VITLYDAARCPYCARVRIVLAEKRVAHDAIEIDLRERPGWIYEKNPTGKVPVLEEDTLVLPESVVIMEYLEERYPEPALLPVDPAARALERWRIARFDDELGDDYYAFRRGEANALLRRLAELDVDALGWGLAAVAYLPWVVRARDMLGVELPGTLAEWVDSCAQRESVRAELEVVAEL
jgi:glutathione S-transferase